MKILLLFLLFVNAFSLELLFSFSQKDNVYFQIEDNVVFVNSSIPVTIKNKVNGTWVVIYDKNDNYSGFFTFGIIMTIIAIITCIVLVISVFMYRYFSRRILQNYALI